MTLADLLPVAARIRERLRIVDLRGIAYLATYPSIRQHARSITSFDETAFHQVAAMVYGWMPRVLRLDRRHLRAATAALNDAATALTGARPSDLPIARVSSCLRSVVGASKMLHFVNDAVFPIWDSKIETFRLGRKPTNEHMTRAKNFVAYVNDVHAILNESGFRDFYVQFCCAYAARLQALGIPEYPISEVRAVEAAAFELAAHGENARSACDPKPVPLSRPNAQVRHGC